MTTMQDVVDLARIDLKDPDKVRWTDADLLKHGNAAIRAAYQLRPDLRLGSYATSVTDKTLSDALPVSDDYKRPVADFIIARASAIDAEYAEGGRTPAYLLAFKVALVGG